jgi:hypothetical protein
MERVTSTNPLNKQMDFFDRGLLVFHFSELNTDESHKIYHDLLLELKDPIYAKIMMEAKEAKSIGETILEYFYAVTFTKLLWTCLALKLTHLSKSYKIIDVSVPSFSTESKRRDLNYIKIKYVPKTSTDYKMLEFKIVDITQSNPTTDLASLKPYFDNGYNVFDIYYIEGLQHLYILYKAIV